MPRLNESVLAELYESDETAWLESMADLIADGQFDDLDYIHLREYLIDMARRDRREVESRLAVLIAHLLKWEYQPSRRSGSWRATIVTQRQELTSLLESGILRNHAEATFDRSYARGLEQAVAETGLRPDQFPADCPDSLDAILSADLPAE